MVAKTEDLFFFIFVVRSTFIVGGWVLVAWSRTPCLEPSEIVSSEFLNLFKNG